MNKLISATDAKSRFAELLRTVKEGQTIAVTSHRKPVSRISPVGEHDRTGESARALLGRLRKERVVKSGQDA